MDRHLQTVKFLATLLDNQFNILGFRFGWSAFVDLLPGIGDTLDALMAMYIVYLAVQLRVPMSHIATMLGNIIIAFVIGLLPIIGDAGYLFYKPNLRNLRLIEEYIEGQGKVIEGEVV